VSSTQFRTASDDGFEQVSDLPLERPGDPDALGVWLEQYRRYLLLVANRELDAEIRPHLAPSDVVQDTLTDAWRGFDRFKGECEEELLAWLRVILLHNIVDAVNRFRRTAKRDIKREIPLEELLSPGSHFGDGGASRLPLIANQPSPSTTAAAAEEKQIIYQALAQLPAHYSQVVRMRNFEYLSFAEIGAQLGISDDAARKTWERAIRSLASVLSSIAAAPAESQS